MGHGHGDPYTIPDYKIYKVKNVPQLLKTEEALKSLGLRDPWLRNEVWRYDVKQFGTESSRLRTLFLRGFKLGFAAFVVTVAGTTVYNKMVPDEHEHEHH